jgi:hypothetical protein
MIKIFKVIYQLYYIVLGWLYDHHLCTHNGFVKRKLAEVSWVTGYMSAVRDLRNKQCYHLRALQVIGSKKNPFFYPTMPRFFSRCFDFLEYWDEGYERAITLNRLGYDPCEMIFAHHELTQPLRIGAVFESSIDQAVRGELRPCPETYRWLDGEVMPAMNEYQLARESCYRKYAETYQQVTAAHTPLITAEILEFSKKELS